jgi:hypothetical protein
LRRAFATRDSLFVAKMEGKNNVTKRDVNVRVGRGWGVRRQSRGQS